MTDQPSDIPRLARAYDSVAARASVAPSEDLRQKPYDRARLDVVAGLALEGRPILDAGCGVGQAAAYLRTEGRAVVAIDAAPEMVRLAQARDPELDVYMMDLRAIQFPEAGFGGLVSCYAAHHVPRASMADVLTGFARVLAPGAPMLLSVYDGEGEREVPSVVDGGEAPVVPVTLWRRDALGELVRALGLFESVRVEGRRPYRFEAPYHRVFVTAIRSG